MGWVWVWAQKFKFKNSTHESESEISDSDSWVEMKILSQARPMASLGIIKSWLAEKGIVVVEWPSYSSDLNLIEHLWRHLKEWINLHHPKLKTMTGDDNIIKEVIVEALQEGWAVLKDELLEKLAESIENRIKAVIKTDS